MHVREQQTCSGAHSLDRDLRLGRPVLAKTAARTHAKRQGIEFRAIGAREQRLPLTRIILQKHKPIHRMRRFCKNGLQIAP